MGYWRRNYAALLGVVFSLGIGITLLCLNLDDKRMFMYYMVCFCFLFFVGKSFNLFFKKIETTNKVLYVLNSILCLLLVFYLVLVEKKPETRLIGGYFLVLPIIRGFVARNWAIQVYYDRYYYLFSIFLILFSPQSTSQIGFIILIVLCFIMTVLLTYLQIMYGSILVRENRD